SPCQLRPSLRQLDGLAHLPETHPCLTIDEAIPALWPKAPLKGCNGDALGRGPYAIPDARQISERGGALDDPDATAAPSRLVCRRLGPQSDAGAREPRPVKQFAGVALAVGCDIGMADNPIRRNAPTRQDIAAQFLDRGHLWFRKRTIPPFMPRIDD